MLILLILNKKTLYFEQKKCYICENSNNAIRKTKYEPVILLEFLQGAREDNRVEKVKLIKVFKKVRTKKFGLTMMEFPFLLLHRSISTTMVEFPFLPLHRSISTTMMESSLLPLHRSNLSSTTMTESSFLPVHKSLIYCQKSNKNDRIFPSPSSQNFLLFPTSRYEKPKHKNLSFTTLYTFFD